MIKKDIYGGNLKDRLKASAKDRLYRFIMADGTLRGAVVHCTRMINEMRSNHDLGVVETLVLGHGYIAAALLTATLKGKDRISIQIQCSGPVKGMDVESNVFGEIRGYLKNPRFSEAGTGGESSVSSFFGAGFLTVTKYLEDARTPYSGRIVMEYGSVAQDLAAYFLQSEQAPTAFNLSICFDAQGQVSGAGGIFLQAMPGAVPDVVADAENVMGSMRSPGQALGSGEAPETLVADVFGRFVPVFMGNQRIEFFCRCSREKMAAYLKGLPGQDHRDILAHGPFPLEIRCHNCNTAYAFTLEDLEALFSGSPGNGQE
ncbi:MAG: Hsp33 family molecular chaperone HslO [Pseudomonadota bacterium]